MRNIIASIQTYNKGRVTLPLQLKYRYMADNTFSFYRGTCHLFYEDWHKYVLPKDTPLAWLCGDMHFGNFGSFKGANKLVYFDMNDFDESFLGPALCDVVRMLTSIRIAATQLAIDRSTVDKLCKTFSNTYAESLAHGHSYMVERDTAEGYVKKFLVQAQNRNNKEFLEKRTDEKQDKLLILEGHTLALSEDERSKATGLFKKWQQQNFKEKAFRLHDAVFRIAGTGSLGIHRYCVLAENLPSGKKVLLDFKEALPASALSFIKQPQPGWVCEADRVSTIQQRMQATSPALLSHVNAGGESYVVKKLQPTEDKVNLDAIANDAGKLEDVVVAMGEILAWNQLRSSGRQKSAIADDLIAWANENDWRRGALEYSKQYAGIVENDYRLFSKSYKEGIWVKP